MKTLRITSLFAVTACLLFSGGALAGNLEKEVGYIDLEWIDVPADASSRPRPTQKTTRERRGFPRVYPAR